jgi:hypothetical protein
MTTRDEQMWSLVLDGACRRVVRHLEGAGHRPIMLKGATIAGWLYPDPPLRVYKDLDVLVSPADLDAVIDSLRDIGFVPLVDRSMLQTSSTEEQPLGNVDGVVIDLHTALKGVRLDPESAWKVFDGLAVPCDWAGHEVRALAPPARAMHLALHTAQRGLVDAKAARDLALGLEVVDRAVWEEAARLADALEATGAFAAGLVLLPAGAQLLDELGVVPPTDRETRMRAGSASTSAIFLERALAAQTWRQRLRVMRGRLFPSARWLRLHEPAATVTAWGMLRTRVRRPLAVVARLPMAFRERRPFRRPVPPSGEAPPQPVSAPDPPTPSAVRHR